MSYIIGNLPPIKCFVRREYLYNFEKERRAPSMMQAWFSSSENKKTNDYNHVLDKLQDYMLNGKTLARTFYQKFSDEETKYFW